AEDGIRDSSVTGVQTCALPILIHCFVPEIRQPSSVAVAAVRSEPASEPASGSVRAKAPRSSPRASGGTKRLFCSSVPKPRIGSRSEERRVGDEGGDGRWLEVGR